jgi:hypothetical protein
MLFIIINYTKGGWPKHMNRNITLENSEGDLARKNNSSNTEER